MIIESDEWIDWYFTPYYESIKRDRENNIPLTKEHIEMCVARLPYKENEKSGAKKWSNKVYKESMKVFKELYIYALETENMIPANTTFDAFINWIHSEDFYNEVGYFGNHFG